MVVVSMKSIIFWFVRLRWISDRVWGSNSCFTKLSIYAVLINILMGYSKESILVVLSQHSHVKIVSTPVGFLPNQATRVRIDGGRIMKCLDNLNSKIMSGDHG